MGIRFGREYTDIIDDLTAALLSMDACFYFLEMTAGEWNELEPEEQRACMHTLADDVFYGMGNDPVMSVGSCTLSHDKDKHMITITQEAAQIHVIHLV